MDGLKSTPAGDKIRKDPGSRGRDPAGRTVGENSIYYNVYMTRRENTPDGKRRRKKIPWRNVLPPAGKNLSEKDYWMGSPHDRNKCL